MVDTKWYPEGVPLVIVASQSQIINQNGATSGFEMCFAPSTFGAGGPTKTRLESSIKKFKPHFIYVWRFRPCTIPNTPSLSMKCSAASRVKVSRMDIFFSKENIILAPRSCSVLARTSARPRASSYRIESFAQNETKRTSTHTLPPPFRCLSHHQYHLCSMKHRTCGNR